MINRLRIKLHGLSPSATSRPQDGFIVILGAFQLSLEVSVEFFVGYAFKIDGVNRLTHRLKINRISKFHFYPLEFVTFIFLLSHSVMFSYAVSVGFDGQSS